MILSRGLYRAPGFIRSVIHQWQYRALKRPNKLKKLMKWDGLQFYSQMYFYSPRLALNPEFSGRMPELRGDLCPTDAMTWEKQVVEIDFSLCTRCHFCLESEPENFSSSHDLAHFIKT